MTWKKLSPPSGKGKSLGKYKRLKEEYVIYFPNYFVPSRGSVKINSTWVIQGYWYIEGSSSRHWQLY